MQARAPAPPAPVLPQCLKDPLKQMHSVGRALELVSNLREAAAAQKDAGSTTQ